MVEKTEGRPNQKLTTQENAYQNGHNWYEKPHEQLVDDIKSVLSAARQKWENRNGTGSFDPVIWIGERLTNKAFNKTGASRQTRTDTSYAWDAIARPYIQSKEYQATLTAVLISATAMRKSSLVTLDPKAVKLIDAMADAVDIPHIRGQKNIDLLTTDQKATFRKIHTQIAVENAI